jgi:hypothetical protein
MQAVRPEIRRVSSTTMQAVRPAVVGKTQIGPRRYGTVQMEAVAPTYGGAQADDDFAFDFDIDAAGALELDAAPMPSRREAPPAEAPALVRRQTPSPMARMTPGPMPRMTPGPMLPPPPSSPLAPSMTLARRPSSTTMAAVDPHAALVAFAGFGDAPSSLWKTPAYALRVIARRRSLRADLERARARRSHDVGLYEASLRTADDAAVRNGIVLFVMLSALALALGVAAALVARGGLSLPW